MTAFIILRWKAVQKSFQESNPNFFCSIYSTPVYNGSNYIIYATITTQK